MSVRYVVCIKVMWQNVSDGSDMKKECAEQHRPHLRGGQCGEALDTASSVHMSQGRGGKEDNVVEEVTHRDAVPPMEDLSSPQNSQAATSSISHDKFHPSLPFQSATNNNNNDANADFSDNRDSAGPSARRQVQQDTQTEPYGEPLSLQPTRAHSTHHVSLQPRRQEHQQDPSTIKRKLCVTRSTSPLSNSSLRALHLLPSGRKNHPHHDLHKCCDHHHHDHLQHHLQSRNSDGRITGNINQNSSDSKEMGTSPPSLTPAGGAAPSQLAPPFTPSVPVPPTAEDALTRALLQIMATQDKNQQVLHSTRLNCHYLTVTPCF